MTATVSSQTFKWTCLGTGLVFGTLLLWMIADFKSKLLAAVEKAESTVGQVQSSVENVNAAMPSLLEELRDSSQTLSRVANDVELMKRVAGLAHDQSDRGVRGLAVYADEIQQVLAQKIEGKPAQILVEEVIGSDLKVLESAEEFLVGLNKEMILTILPLSKSRQEVLYRVCRSGIRRKPFYIQLGEHNPQRLEEFIREQHSASRDLPSHQVEE